MSRVALITGAASGIGRACAQKLARQDVTVVIVDRDRDRGNTIANELMVALSMPI